MGGIPFGILTAKAASTGPPRDCAQGELEVALPHDAHEFYDADHSAYGEVPSDLHPGPQPGLDDEC